MARANKELDLQERDQLRAEVERLKHGTVAQFKDAFIDELKRENTELREWQAGVIANAKLHHAERKDAIARAERAEAELAVERARLDWLEDNLYTLWASGLRCNESPAVEISAKSGRFEAESLRAAIDAARKEAQP